MIRLPFRLPEWAPRTTWASEEAKVWASRFNRISNVWINAERELVVTGDRPSTLQNVTTEQLPELIKDLAPKGLIVLPLARTPRAQGYQSASRSAQPGELQDYRCAITKPEHAADWARAWSNSDDAVIGSLLGYPKCCQQFFEQKWKLERWMDTTWPMFETGGAGRALVRGGVNMLWRWHGIRPVSHLPCSFECEQSIRMAAEGQSAVAAVDPQAAEWMKEVLSWPVEWSSLHGIGILTSPISRTTFATDALASKAVVRFDGGGYPDEAGKGQGFPFNAARHVRITRSDPAANGFSSLAAMNLAHDGLLKAIRGPYSVVLDLGCGDGTLLAKVPCKRRVGVEIDPARAKKAESRIQRAVVGNCSDPELVNRLLQEEQPDLIIAQRDRNPPGTLSGCAILSYSYEVGAAPPDLLSP